MNTPVREGETIEGSRTMRNRPYPVLKCSIPNVAAARRPFVSSSSPASPLIIQLGSKGETDELALFGALFP